MFAITSDELAVLHVGPHLAIRRAVLVARHLPRADRRLRAGGSGVREEDGGRCEGG